MTRMTEETLQMRIRREKKMTDTIYHDDVMDVFAKHAGIPVDKLMGLEVGLRTSTLLTDPISPVNIGVRNREFWRTRKDRGNHNGETRTMKKLLKLKGMGK